MASLPSVTRRTLLGACASAALVAMVRPARAAARIGPVTRDERGTTFMLDLLNAPFPAPGAPYADSTVIVFVPSHFRVGRDNAVPMVIHFHGHTTTALSSIVAHELREQLFDSKQNAILVAPQGPVMAADSAAGKLEAPGGLSRMLSEALVVLGSNEAARALERDRIPPGSRIGNVCLSAHSGGYHAAAACLRAGGVQVNEVYLFDALYAEADAFRDWVIAGKGRSMRERHKLVSYYGAGAATEAQSRWLRAELERAGVRSAYEEVEGTLSREEILRGEAVFVRTAVSHGDVTHTFNALRDCLYASGLPRTLRTSWFDHKGEARRLDRRP